MYIRLLVLFPHVLYKEVRKQQSFVFKYYIPHSHLIFHQNHLLNIKYFMLHTCRRLFIRPVQ